MQSEANRVALGIAQHYDIAQIVFSILQKDKWLLNNFETCVRDELEINFGFNQIADKFK